MSSQLCRSSVIWDVTIEDDGDVVRIHGVGFDGLKAPQNKLDMGNLGHLFA